MIVQEITAAGGVSFVQAPHLITRNDVDKIYFLVKEALYNIADHKSYSSTKEEEKEKNKKWEAPGEAEKKKAHKESKAKGEKLIEEIAGLEPKTNFTETHHLNCGQIKKFVGIFGYNVQSAKSCTIDTLRHALQTIDTKPENKEVKDLLTSERRTNLGIALKEGCPLDFNRGGKWSKCEREHGAAAIALDSGRLVKSLREDAFLKEKLEQYEAILVRWKELKGGNGKSNKGKGKGKSGKGGSKGKW